MKYVVLMLCVYLCACDNNLRVVGDDCDECEAVLEYNKRKLSYTDTLISYQRGEKPALKLAGRVLESDGITPAKGAIVYIYQTNEDGWYETAPVLKDWGRKHGIIRGWLKTNETGQYVFMTTLPGYVSDSITPRTIHMMVKESNSIPYRLDNIYFTDDPRLTSNIIQEQKGRGGESILTPRWVDDVMVVQKDIILGKNIPNYTPKEE